MNFLEKIEKESMLSFLLKFGFTPNSSCAYGCCKGYLACYYSSEGLYYNRCVVSFYKNSIVVKNHQEYNCGGEIGTDMRMIPLGKFKGVDLQRKILDAISEVLPSDLD